MSEKFRFNVKKDRPEEKYRDVRDYYQGEVLESYASSKSMMRIQERITKRALEIIQLKAPSLILDAGSGPGFCGIFLKALGYRIVSLDLIPEFLSFYNIKELNPIAGDLRTLPFKKGVFDAIISISALQWIFRGSKEGHFRSIHLKEMPKYFYDILKPKSKAIFQFYPKSSSIMKRIGNFFVTHANFKGNYIVDHPENPKKRKIFLLLEK